ncbi:aminoglycoside 3'-phosphotransferase [Nesterenkonia sp.]|uniref:aminoglycoside 3'-phosphotransferase n=1 Tax=Nesterenkonia sp. TaxID=704201 RepID=UPI0026048697|nr:aminoglycoside 3'-phosphotransferase [Nesterenkonia sp.]
MPETRHTEVETVSAGVPQEPVAVPEPIRQLAGAAQVRPIWRNELGGTTFALGSDRYAKWQPHTDRHPEHVDLQAEAQRTTWAGRFTAVPQVLQTGTNDDGAWLLTAAVSGTSAYHPRWRSEPETAVRAIAVGLRRLHDALPTDCPFTCRWAAPGLDSGAEDVVVCHGDPCVPNTLLDRDGRFAAHVDLGQLGLGERWADLAIASWSIRWPVNFGRSYDDLFFASYGVTPDPDRIAYYRDLWEAGS